MAVLQSTNLRRFHQGFSLVEVVLALGLVAFGILATFGLMTVGHDTITNGRNEAMAARLAHNEFSRIRSLKTNFPNTPPNYDTRYFTSSLVDVNATDKADALSKNALYQFDIESPFATGAYGSGDWTLNGRVSFPIAAASPTVLRFVTTVNNP